MATDSIPYPTDPATVGRRTATRSRTEDGVLKQFDRVHVEDDRVRSGLYHWHTGAHTVQAAAQAAGTGFWFLFNPVGSTVLVALRRVEFMSQLNSALVAPTAPRLALVRFTATGTFSGTNIAPAKRRTSDANSVSRNFAANTGLTITEGATIFSFLPIASATAVGYTAPASDDWLPEVAEQPILAAGEGLVFKQLDAATTGDTRRFVTNALYDEFTEY